MHVVYYIFNIDNLPWPNAPYLPLLRLNFNHHNLIIMYFSCTVYYYDCQFTLARLSCDVRRWRSLNQSPLLAFEIEVEPFKLSGRNNM